MFIYRIIGSYPDGKFRVVEDNIKDRVTAFQLLDKLEESRARVLDQEVSGTVYMEFLGWIDYYSQLKPLRFKVQVKQVSAWYDAERRKEVNT